jgi:hypothetical protein
MWRFRKNNLLINERDELFVHKVHLERLLHAKTHIQNKGPDIPYFMKNKLSKKETMRVKERKRCYENSIIFSRLLEINKACSPYSKTNTPLYCPAFDKKKHNFDKIEKQNELNKHNEFLFNRFVKEKSFYPTQHLLDINDFENYLRGNIKRQHIANPNIRFATFSQFKKNISRNYILRRSNSAKTFRNNYEPKTDPLKMEKNDKNNYSNFSNIVPNKNYNNRLKKNKRNNNNISSNSTATASKMGRSLSRCQSAFILRNKNNF